MSKFLLPACFPPRFPAPVHTMLRVVPCLGCRLSQYVTMAAHRSSLVVVSSRSFANWFHHRRLRIRPFILLVPDRAHSPRAESIGFHDRFEIDSTRSLGTHCARRVQVPVTPRTISSRKGVLPVPVLFHCHTEAPAHSSVGLATRPGPARASTIRHLSRTGQSLSCLLHVVFREFLCFQFLRFATAQRGLLLFSDTDHTGLLRLRWSCFRPCSLAVSCCVTWASSCASCCTCCSCCPCAVSSARTSATSSSMGWVAVLTAIASSSAHFFGLLRSGTTAPRTCQDGYRWV